MVAAQATASERSQINVEQQLSWNYLIEAEWEYLRKLNTPTHVFNSVHEKIQLNFGESYSICNDEILKILGDKDKKDTIKTY